MAKISLHAFQKRSRAILASRVAQLTVVVAGTALITTLVLYLTPLHYLNMVEPATRDVDAATIYQKMQVAPQEYLFVDVRNASTYQAGHALGAINIPIHDLYDDRFALPKNGKTIVLICGDGKLAGVAYGYLEHYGFLNLARIEGGLHAWQEAGLPTEKS
jgi:rhodanese-related sulfurtransferase